MRTTDASKDAASPTPIVGMGATVDVGSDSYPATIVQTSRSFRRITVQRDRFWRTDITAPRDDQSYFHAPDPNGEVETYSLRGNGRYVVVGHHASSGKRLRVGVRDVFIDPQF